MERNRIYCGNALDILQTFPDETISCLVTSPPYWGQRKYAGKEQNQVWDGRVDCDHEWIPAGGGLLHENRNFSTGTQEEVLGTRQTTHIFKYDREGSNFCSKCGAWFGQLGLEPTPQLYCKHIVQVLHECRHVLHKDGTAFLNIGDTYAGGGGASGHTEQTQNLGRSTSSYGAVATGGIVPEGLKTKDLCLIPERLAILLQENGWFVRDRIAWLKKTSMPESVKDRRTRCWEYVWMLTKSKDYWYDADAVRTTHKRSYRTITWREREKKGATGGCLNTGSKQQLGTGWSHDLASPSGSNARNVIITGVEPLGYEMCNLCHHIYNTREYRLLGVAAEQTGIQKVPRVCAFCGSTSWTSHFAVFPKSLVTPLILATCPAWVCRKCGKPRTRVKRTIGSTVTEAMVRAGCNRNGNYHGQTMSVRKGSLSESPSDAKRSILKSIRKIQETTGWTDCGCRAGFDPGVVLDPFVGSGTVPVVAATLGRDWTGIDVSEDYVRLANERIRREGQRPRHPVTSLEHAEWWKKAKRGLCSPLLLLVAFHTILQGTWRTLSRIL
jgi:DNA modification methylase